MKLGLVLLAIVASAVFLNVVVAIGSDWTNGKGVVLPLKNRPTHKLTRLGTKGPIVPMHGNLTFWAEFFVTMGLGTPPQNMLVDIDTGTLLRTFSFAIHDSSSANIYACPEIRISVSSSFESEHWDSYYSSRGGIWRRGRVARDLHSDLLWGPFAVSWYFKDLRT